MVRNYTEESVDRAVLEAVVAAGARAPSAGYTQGHSFVVVTEPARREAIATLADEEAYVAAGFEPWISRAPAHVVVCVSEEAYRRRYREPDKRRPGEPELEWPVPYWFVDAGAALMAILLAAVDAGLAAGFLGVHSLPGLRQLLRIPDDVTPIGVVTVGHPAPDRPSGSLRRGRLPLERMVHWEAWSDPDRPAVPPASATPP